MRQFRYALLAALTALAVTSIGQAAEGGLVFDYARLQLDGGTTSHGESVGKWTGDGWLGGDYERFWWKTDGSVTAGKLEDGDLQLLYGRYVAQFWDVQAGYRREWKPRPTNQGVLAVKGIAPYWFEVDAGLFLGGPGTVGGRLSVEYELLWTQRLISRPAVRLDWTAKSDRAGDVGNGFTSAELQLQTRYEVTREFAPYASVRYERKLGRTADFARAVGERPDSVAFSLGVWLIF